MLLKGHTAVSVTDRPGFSNTNVLYRWKKEHLAKSGRVASTLEAHVKELKDELRRVEREREVLKKRCYFRPQRIADVYAAIETILTEDCSNTVEGCRILHWCKRAVCVLTEQAWPPATVETQYGVVAP